MFSLFFSHTEHTAQRKRLGVTQKRGFLSGWSLIFMQRQTKLWYVFFIFPLYSIPFPLFPLPSVLVVCPAATGCLAESPGLCARLIFTTALKSASASPTTWGLGGISNHHLFPINTRIQNYKQRRRIGWEFYTYWITANNIKGFLSLLSLLTQKGIFSSETKMQNSHPCAAKTHKWEKKRETFNSGIQKEHSPDWKWTVINGNYKAWQQRWNGLAGVHPCCDMFEHGAAPAACFRDVIECVKWKVEQSNNSSRFL